MLGLVPTSTTSSDVVMVDTVDVTARAGLLSSTAGIVSVVWGRKTAIFSTGLTLLENSDCIGWVFMCGLVFSRGLLFSSSSFILSQSERRLWAILDSTFAFVFFIVLAVDGVTTSSSSSLCKNNELREPFLTVLLFTVACSSPHVTDILFMFFELKVLSSSSSSSS
jgi:hypothetical protein